VDWRVWAGDLRTSNLEGTKCHAHTLQSPLGRGLTEQAARDVFT